MRYSFLFFFLIVLTFLSVQSAEAQVVPELTSIFPQGGGRGTTVKATLNGQNLTGATKILISGSGVSGQLKAQESPKTAVIFSGQGVVGQVSKDGSFSADISIDAEAPIGVREVRLVTPNGLSNPLLFVVGYLPEIVETEPNNSSDRSMPVNPPVVINGRIDPAEDWDYFSFAAKEGQRLILEMKTAQINSSLDSFLTLFDAEGKELAANAETSEFESLIDYTVPKSGDYIVQLRDLKNQGGPLFLYRLSIGSLPYIDGLFPLGGKRGTTVNVSLSGRNLDGMTSTQISIAPDAPIGIQEMRVLTPGGFSNSHPFAVGDFPEILEKEPNNSDTPPVNPITPPVAINGKMDSKGDRDSFSFKAEKGQRLIFEVNARRLHSSIDPFLRLLDSEGKVLANNDDALGYEAMIDYKFQEAGEYVIQLRDLTDQGGPDYAYRLNVSPPMADFKLSVSPDNPRGNRGSSVALTVNLSRSPGFGKEVALSAVDLPKGFYVSPAIITSNQTQALLTITIPPDAPIGHMPVKIIGLSESENQRIVHQAQPMGTFKRANQTLTLPTSDLFLTVMDALEFNLALIPVSVNLKGGTSTNVAVSAVRQGGFKGAISLSVSGLPKGVSASQVNIAEEQNQAAVALTASGDAELGTQNIVVSGTATVVNQQFSLSTEAIPLTVMEAPLILSLTPNNPSLEQGGVVVITASAVRKGLFTGAISLSTSGLPEGVTASEAVISEGQTEAVILLTAGQDAKPGSFKNIVISGNINVNDQKVSQPAPAITLTVTAKSKSETASSSSNQ